MDITQKVAHDAKYTRPNDHKKPRVPTRYKTQDEFKQSRQREFEMERALREVIDL